MALGDNSCTRGQLAVMPASEWTTAYEAQFNEQLAMAEGVVDSLCAPACAEESLPTLNTKVAACASSLVDMTNMQCSPACTDMLSAVQASACYTSLSFASSIPADVWTYLEGACALFDTCVTDYKNTIEPLVQPCADTFGSMADETHGPLQLLLAIVQ